jgi:hypothetical protein
MTVEARFRVAIVGTQPQSKVDLIGSGKYSKWVISQGRLVTIGAIRSTNYRSNLKNDPLTRFS